MPASYIGRFAPSPSGPLHLGSLVTALASYLDAKAHAGRWLLRIEDIDEPRTVAGADRLIMQQLTYLGLVWDGDPVWQTKRHKLYKKQFNRLLKTDKVYGCSCKRKSLKQGPYPGTCLKNPPKPIEIRAWRFKVTNADEIFIDRWFGEQSQNPANECGDFIIKRADGLWAYQLAVVVDDAQQAISHIVRGADLLSSCGRQRQLEKALGFNMPALMHIPLVCNISGQKLSKQNHAPPIDIRHGLNSLQQAWNILGFDNIAAKNTKHFLQLATIQWANRYL